MQYNAVNVPSNFTHRATSSLIAAYEWVDRRREFNPPRCDIRQACQNHPTTSVSQYQRLCGEYKLNERSNLRQRSGEPRMTSAVAEFDPRRTIQSYFADIARANADRPAILSGGTVISYTDLDRRSNRFARLLSSRGVRPGSIVGLFLPRSPDAVITMLAILKLGAAFAPLDPAYPADRITFIAADATPAVVVSSSHMFSTKARPWTAPTVHVDLEAQAIARESDMPLAENVAGNDLAYIMYTSGTTGRPKGVMVPHRGVTRLAHNSFIDLRHDDVVLHFAPLAFDASTLEIWGPLLNGAALAILAAVHPSYDEIGATVIRHNVSTAWFTAGLFHAIVDHQIEILRPLRQLIAGGDVLSPRHVRRVLDALPNCRLVNGYGPTENTTFTCCYTVPLDISADAPIPIGRPIDHTAVYVLNREFRPVAVGEEGELFAAGEGVALGYLKRPDLTSEKFLPDSFGGQPGRLMYRTGDVVRQRQDGVIEFIGRVDNQVKINGYRIELGEIEVRLSHHPAVREAVVIAREDRPGTKRLVAYYTVVSDAEKLGGQELRRHLAAVLPEYMVPASYVRLEAMPLTPNGKLDREALALGPSAPAIETGGPLPRSPDEALLCRLFAQMTGQAAVDVDSDFFTIGGDSLAAMILVTKLRQLGRDLHVSTLLSARTPSAIAAAWAAGTHAAAATPQPTLFIIPGANADGTSLTGLCIDWSDVLDCVQLDYPDWPRFAAPGFDMDDLVADFARRIRDRAPVGPLLLAGYSLGGVIAWALAKHFADTAQPVELLLILDADVSRPLTGGADIQSAGRIHSNIERFATMLGSHGCQQALGYSIAHCISNHPALLRLLAGFRHLRLPTRLRYWLRFALCWKLYVRTVHLWQIGTSAAARPLDKCTVILFRATEGERTPTPDMGWRTRCGDLQIYEVAGDHLSILSERGSHSLHERLPEVLQIRPQRLMVDYQASATSVGSMAI